MQTAHFLKIAGLALSQSSQTWLPAILTSSLFSMTRRVGWVTKYCTSIAQCDKVLHSVTKYWPVWQSIAKCDKILHGIRASDQVGCVTLVNKVRLIVEMLEQLVVWQNTSKCLRLCKMFDHLVLSKLVVWQNIAICWRLCKMFDHLILSKLVVWHRGNSAPHDEDVSLSEGCCSTQYHLRSDSVSLSEGCFSTLRRLLLLHSMPSSIIF